MTSPAWGTSGKALTGFVTGAISKASGEHSAVQVAVGVGLLLGILTGIAAGFGVLMNLNYLLAGTVSINPILGMFGLFLCFAWRVCGWIGIDRWLLPALSLPWKPGTWFRSPTTEAPISPV